MERTLCIIKPDATRRNLVDSINKIIEDGGLKVIVKKNIKLSGDTPPPVWLTFFGGCDRHEMLY